jgi:20S proteasome alpha/beta subunit
MIQNRGNNRSIEERLKDHEGMDRAVQNAVREALRRHMLLGESVAVADETGKGVKTLGPEEIRKLLEST